MTVVILLPALVLLLVVRRAGAHPSDRFVRQWATAHALTLTPVNRPFVEYYLRNSKLLRTLGGLAGLLLPVPIAAAAGWHVERFPASWGWIFAGYLVGAVYAELTLGRPAGSERIAALRPRVLRDYLPGRLLVGQWVIAACALVVGVATAATDRTNTDTDVLAPRTALVIGVVTLLVIATVVTFERFVLARPQPVVHSDLLAADDAVRASSLHTICGSGLAIALLLLSWLLANLGATTSTLDPLPDLAAVAAGFGSFAAWLYYGHRAWRVQHPAIAISG